MRDKVILVNSEDEITGEAPKLEAHLKGLLHRAFSVLVVNSKDDILLQKRAVEKYHSPGLWSNTCCSHPQPGEEINSSAEARLSEEMGFQIPLKFINKFHYEVKLENDLTENEIDYIFIGRYEGPVNPDPEEVSDYKWISKEELSKAIAESPKSFTYWLPKVLDLVYQS